MIDKENGVTEAAAAATGLGELVAKRIAPISDWTDMGRYEHFVQFYESTEFLINSASEYITHGLKVGETCIVAATHDHLQELAAAMGAFQAEFDRAAADGRYVAVDADETLESIIVDGIPDRNAFFQILSPILDAAVERKAEVRIFGEMGGLLCLMDNFGAAVKLEGLWNELRQMYRFSLFCAYPMHSLDKAAGDVMSTICADHTRVIPEESYTSLTSADARLRKIAHLQQKNRRLQAEIDELELRISNRVSDAV